MTYKKNNRQLKITNAAAEDSFLKGKLQETKVIKYFMIFKSLPGYQAIFALTNYLKGIKLQMEKNTLVIESSTKLDALQLKQVEYLLKTHFQISEVQSKLNPSLLGGLKLKIGDTVIDNSLNAKISQLGEVIHG